MNVNKITPFNQKRFTKRDIRSVFIRSNFFQGSWNFERMQALGFCFTMIPVIQRLYPIKNKDRKEAIKRHLEFFNTHPYLVAPILGVIMAMEEERANGAPIDDAAINSLKIGFMGPLAGIGDPIFWGTIRPIFSALGAGIAIGGNLLGPLLFFIPFNIIRLTTRYYGITYGYKKGITIVNDIKGGALKKITEGSSILGLFIMGALINKWTHINIPVVLSQNTNDKGNVTVITLQSVFDQLMPGLIPLLLTFACMWMLQKKINALWIIVGLFIISIFGYWIGIFGL